ncbi:hypothetical protein D3C85_1448830 [compost metagenome]
MIGLAVLLQNIVISCHPENQRLVVPALNLTSVADTLYKKSTLAKDSVSPGTAPPPLFLRLQLRLSPSPIQRTEAPEPVVGVSSGGINLTLI